MRLRLFLVASVTLVVALLAARAAIVPVLGFEERQWTLRADGGTAELLRRTRTRWARVVSETDATLARPGDVRVEWRGFLTLDRAGSLAGVAESAGPAAVSVDGRELLRIEGGTAGRARGVAAVTPGPHELLARVDVPAHDAFFKAVLRLPDGAIVPLEEAPCTTSPVSGTEAERARRFRAWADPALAIAVLCAAGGIVAALRAASLRSASLHGAALPGDLLRSAAPSAARDAEIAATALVLATALLVPHGAGLDAWGTFPWGGLPVVPRTALLLTGLVPWLIASARRPLPVPRLRASALAAATLALATFGLLRERRFWGDAWITLRILEGRAREGAFGPFFWKEPLDRIVAVVATRIAALAGAGAASAVAATSCAAGAAVVAALVLDRRRGGRDDWTAGAVLTAGAALLFFGHVENYTWVSAATVVFLLLATRAAAGEMTPAWAGGVGGLALAFHPVAIFAVGPGLLALAAASRRPRDVLALAASALAIPALLVVACTAAGVAPPSLGLNRFADDPAVLRSPAAAFAASALGGVANRLVLILSPGIALALLAGLARARRPSRAALPLVAAALGACVHLVFLQGKIRPEVSDWDLYAPAAFPIAMLAGRALRGAERASARAWCTGVSAAVLLLGVLGGLHR